MPYCKLSFSFLSRNGILIAKKQFDLNKLNRKQSKKKRSDFPFIYLQFRSCVEFFFSIIILFQSTSLYSFDRNYHKMISLGMISIYCFNRIDVFYLQIPSKYNGRMDWIETKTKKKRNLYVNIIDIFRFHWRQQSNCLHSNNVSIIHCVNGKRVLCFFFCCLSIQSIDFFFFSLYQTTNK